MPAGLGAAACPLLLTSSPGVEWWPCGDLEVGSVQGELLNRGLCLLRLATSKVCCVFREGAVRVGADCVLKSREVVLEITRQGCGSWFLEPAWGGDTKASHCQ